VPQRSAAPASQPSPPPAFPHSVRSVSALHSHQPERTGSTCIRLLKRRADPRRPRAVDAIKFPSLLTVLFRARDLAATLGTQIKFARVDRPISVLPFRIHSNLEPNVAVWRYGTRTCLSSSPHSPLTPLHSLLNYTPAQFAELTGLCLRLTGSFVPFRLACARTGWSLASMTATF
jgi:hypothetical protein